MTVYVTDDPLLTLLIGLEERADHAGHDMASLVFLESDQATMSCRNCDAEVLAMLTNDMAAWRVDPDIAALDTTCEAGRDPTDRPGIDEGHWT